MKSHKTKRPLVTQLVTSSVLMCSVLSLLLHNQGNTPERKQYVHDYSVDYGLGFLKFFK